ncbi:hypothetical protein As57867_017329, partial [Aphanomyces stellatus]
MEKPKQRRGDILVNRIKDHLSVGPKMKLEIGETVVLSKPLKAVALVCSNVDPMTASFAAAWYLRPSDLPKSTVARIAGGLGSNEVIQSTTAASATISIDAVVAKCHVIAEGDVRDRVNVFRLRPSDAAKEEIFVCRFRLCGHTLERLRDPHDVRLGLRKTVRVGTSFQVTTLPWCMPDATLPFLGTRRWSPPTQLHDAVALEMFLRAVNRMRFEVGAVVKVFLHDGGGGGGV